MLPYGLCLFFLSFPFYYFNFYLSYLWFFFFFPHYFHTHSSEGSEGEAWWSSVDCWWETTTPVPASIARSQILAQQRWYCLGLNTVCPINQHHLRWDVLWFDVPVLKLGYLTHLSPNEEVLHDHSSLREGRSGGCPWWCSAPLEWLHACCFCFESRAKLKRWCGVSEPGSAGGQSSGQMSAWRSAVSAGSCWTHGVRVGTVTGGLVI